MLGCRALMSSEAPSAMQGRGGLKAHVSNDFKTLCGGRERAHSVGPADQRRRKAECSHLGGGPEMTAHISHPGSWKVKS